MSWKKGTARLEAPRPVKTAAPGPATTAFCSRIASPFEGNDEVVYAAEDDDEISPEESELQQILLGGGMAAMAMDLEESGFYYYDPKDVFTVSTPSTHPNGLDSILVEDFQPMGIDDFPIFSRKRAVSFADESFPALGISPAPIDPSMLPPSRAKNPMASNTSFYEYWLPQVAQHKNQSPMQQLAQQLRLFSFTNTSPAPLLQSRNRSYSEPGVGPGMMVGGF